MRKNVLPAVYRMSVNAKGQVTIPAALRRKYGLKPKTRLVISEKRGQIVLTPVEVLIRQLRGSLKGGSSLTQALLEDRAKDKELEEAKWQRYLEWTGQKR
ncbi:MAG: AbrB/MazE/SpoVT family DNA-binding domain-containing protein [Anaerolineales bacterium]